MRLAAALIVCFAAWSILRGPYFDAIAWATQPIVGHWLVEFGPVTTQIQSGSLVAQLVLHQIGEPSQIALVKVDGILQSGWNLPLFLALLAMMPRRQLRRVGTWAVPGTAIIVLSHVLILSLALLLTTHDHLAQTNQSPLSASTARLIHGAHNFLLATRYILPFVLMAPLWILVRRACGPAR